MLVFLIIFLYLLYLFMIISYFTLLLSVIPQTTEIDIGIAIKPIPVRLNVVELDFVPIKRTLSIDFSIVVIVLCFLYFFFDLLFLSLK